MWGIKREGKDWKVVKKHESKWKNEQYKCQQCGRKFRLYTNDVIEFEVCPTCGGWGNRLTKANGGE